MNNSNLGGKLHTSELDRLGFGLVWPSLHWRILHLADNRGRWEQASCGAVGFHIFNLWWGCLRNSQKYKTKLRASPQLVIGWITRLLPQISKLHDLNHSLLEAWVRINWRIWGISGCEGVNRSTCWYYNAQTRRLSHRFTAKFTPSS